MQIDLNGDLGNQTFFFWRRNTSHRNAGQKQTEVVFLHLQWIKYDAEGPDGVRDQ